MARDIVAKHHSNLNLYSRRHIHLYQRVLFIGTQMASMVSHLENHIGLPKALIDSAEEWSSLMTNLADLIT